MRPDPLGVLAAALALLAGACGGERQPTPSPPPPPGSTSTVEPDPEEPRFVFVDVASEAGLDAAAWCGRPSKPHLLESGGDGIALLDHDGDGDLDAYVVSGWRLEGARVVEKAANRLYRNRGDGTFEDVTDSAGVGDEGFGTGVAAGDYDGDGHLDLFVSNFGPDVLYHNEGDGTFRAVADGPGIDGWSAGACFFDADGDGDDDLFVAAYIECSLQEVLEAEPTLDWKGTRVMFGPFGLPGKANVYFRNDGGTFVAATDDVGLTDVGEYFSFGVAAADFDGDADLDLYVANDSNPNYVYRNDGGRFTEVGLWCGASLAGDGPAQAGMGVGVGDLDGDGLLDVLVTNFAEDSCALYRNLGRLLFRDVARTAGLRGPTYEPLSWGVVFADLDLDGDEDVFIANGHIYPQADTAPESKMRYAQTNLLLETHAGSLRDVSADSGPGLAVRQSSRGVAMGDVDGDGDVDLLVSNVDAPPTLLRNDSPRRGHWLLVDAPWALRVTVQAGDTRLVRHHVAGGSFCSVSDARFHFGLGTADVVTVTVVGLDGSEAVVRDVAADQVVRIPSPR